MLFVSRKVELIAVLSEIYSTRSFKKVKLQGFFFLHISCFSCQPNKANDPGGVCVPIEARLTHLETDTSDNDCVTPGYNEHNLYLLTMLLVSLDENCMNVFLVLG